MMGTVIRFMLIVCLLQNRIKTQDILGCSDKLSCQKCSTLKEYIETQLRNKEHKFEKQQKQIDELLKKLDSQEIKMAKQQEQIDNTTQILTKCESDLSDQYDLLMEHEERLTLLEKGATVTMSTTAKPISDGVSGRRFLLAFLKNHPDFGKEYAHCLVTSNAVGLLEIKVPFLNISEHRTLQVGQNIVNISHTVWADSFVIENKAIYIETTTDVNVYAMNIEYLTSDGFYVIPQDQLSTEYVIVTEEPFISSKSDYNSEVLVVATHDNTSVRFKLNTNGTVMYKQQSHDNNRDLTITLNQYETFQIEHNHDLTGTVILSSNPIAVISGNKCGNAILSSGCSHLSEMVPPVSLLGKKYIIPMFPSRNILDHYVRIICTRNKTGVNYTIEGHTLNVNLGQSESISKQISKNDFMFLTTTKPVLVSVSVPSYYGPFMIILPGIDQFLSNYTFAVPSAGFNSYGKIIIKSTYVSGLYLDGYLVNASCSIVETAFLNDQYCLLEIMLTPGYHIMYQENEMTFGLFVYGWREDDGYGFSAGMKLGR